MATNKVPFYGSDEIYRAIQKIFVPVDGGSRIHGESKNNLIIQMLNEIDPKRTIRNEEIFMLERKKLR